MNSALGKYQANNTFIHKLDPRIKLISLIVLMVSIFMTYTSNTFMNLTIYGFIFVLLLLLSLLAKVSFIQIFKSLLGIWMMILFVLILNVFFTKPSDLSVGIAFSIGSLNIYWLAITNMLYVFSRLLIVIMITNIFTSTTKPMEMTNALEWLLFPLSLIKIPVHKFAMAVSLALRFIPTLQEETSRIMKAQASRGVDYQHGKFKEKIKALIALIIPLFMSAFTTSGQLADAMEARGYDPNSKRTKYKNQNFSYRDVIGIIFVLSSITAIVLLSVLKPDMYQALNIGVPQIR